MATYIYETIPEDDGRERRTFELQQSMKDSPLTHDPETGQRVRRLISGGLGIMGSRRGLSIAGGAASGGDCCPTCHD